MRLESALRHGPVAVLKDDGEGLQSITRDVLSPVLKQYGYVVLRNFDTDLSGFSAFVRKHSTRLSLDPARVFHDADGKPVAQKVDAGTDAIGLHCENGNNPAWPDLCWFYCEQAPEKGSQTTVCDGVDVFNDMSRSGQEAFQSQDVIYSRRVAEHLWKTYATYDVDKIDPSVGTGVLFERLQSMVSDKEGAQLSLHDDGSITYRFRTSAVQRNSAVNPSFHAFANSIFGPSYNYEHPVITFADGMPLDDTLMKEAANVCAKHTRNIDWQKNDIVVIDNRRVMHGRRAIVDTNRVIYNALSYIQEAVWPTR